MIHSYRPLPPLAPPPPPPPGPAPLRASAPAPAAGAPAWPQATAPQPWPQPVRTSWLNWDPLSELAFSMVSTPLAALAGAGIGFLIAGPLGAARGAMLGASLPGAVFVGHELIFKSPWWGSAPNPTNPLAIAALGGFAALSAVGFGVGTLIAGSVGAAWGTLIAAALPFTLVMVGSAVYRWLHPPVYDPGPLPAPTTPGPRPL